jgi:hypothetical protein
MHKVHAMLKTLSGKLFACVMSPLCHLHKPPGPLEIVVVPGILWPPITLRPCPASRPSLALPSLTPPAHIR